MSNSNNNQINIPLTREAMDRFKMQAVPKELRNFVGKTGLPRGMCKL